jgi:hypothetical protein
MNYKSPLGWLSKGQRKPQCHLSGRKTGMKKAERLIVLGFSFGGDQLIKRGEAQGTGLIGHAPACVRLGSHDEGQGETVHDVVMRDVIAMVILTVQSNCLHIDIFGR